MFRRAISAYKPVGQRHCPNTSSKSLRYSLGVSALDLAFLYLSVYFIRIGDFFFLFLNLLLVFSLPSKAEVTVRCLCFSHKTSSNSSTPHNMPKMYYVNKDVNILHDCELLIATSRALPKE